MTIREEAEVGDVFGALGLGADTVVVPIIATMIGSKDESVVIHIFLLATNLRLAAYLPRYLVR